MEPHSTPYHSQGLVRALRLLRVLGTADRALRLAELAAALELPKSTLIRLLTVLEDEEFVYREGDPASYTVGHAVLEITESFRRQANVVDVAAPYLKRVAQETGLTANIGTLEGRWVLHICVEEPDRPLRFRSSNGSLDHTHCTGLGKMLLSALSGERLGDHLPSEEPFTSFTEHTITDRAALESELERVRDRGYSIDDQERDTGVVCMALAIPNRLDLNVALSVAGPAGELTEARRPATLRILRDTASALGTDSRFLAALRAGSATTVTEVTS
jgi:DNA-binding IclR family transcriptional regulator